MSSNKGLVAERANPELLFLKTGRGRWPKSEVYNAENPSLAYTRRFNPSFVRGLEGASLPTGSVYRLEQNRQRSMGNVLKNHNVNDLPDGRYLYLIEYEPSTRKYYKQFVQVLTKLELGSKHFMLPTHEGERVVLAAGELHKEGGRIIWNLRSGTFMSNFIKNQGGQNWKYKEIVRNAFRNSRATLEFQNRNLLPNVPHKLGALITSLAAGKAEITPNSPSASAMLPYLQRQHNRRLEAGLTTPGGAVAGARQRNTSGNTPQSKKPKP